MPKLAALLLGRAKAERRFSVDDYLAQFGFGGLPYSVIGTNTNTDREQVENSFTGYVRSAYKSNGIVFAAMLARLMIFGEARFQFQRLRDGKAGDLFGTRELAALEKPWPNGTTGELLARMIQDADLAGNFYAPREGKRLRRLRPDWVQIVLTAPPSEAVQSDIVGYLYYPGGIGSGVTPQPYSIDEMCHWCPIPDPEAQYRGMSWITPVLREIQSDRYATEHKARFFENGATLSTVISLKETVGETQFRKFLDIFKKNHEGVDNAYRNLVVGGGADVKVVGADLQQLDFKATQGAGETRVASASGVHPVILGTSEGLAGSSLNAGNFNSARRLTADKTMRPLWRSACAALSTIVKVPDDARLWYDERDISFLREDRGDLAKIQQTEAVTLRSLIDGGFLPDSVTAAVMNYDWKLLQHSGNLSVQLQPAEPADQPTDEPPADEPAAADDQAGQDDT